MYTYFLHNGRTVFQITTQINTTRAHVLHQQVVGRNLLNWSTGKSDYNQTCSEGKPDLSIYPIIVVYWGMRSEKWDMRNEKWGMRNEEWIWAPNRTLRRSWWEKIASVPTGSNTTLLPPYTLHSHFTNPYPTLDLIFEYRGSFGINHMNSAGGVLRRNQLLQERLLLTSPYYTNRLQEKTEGRVVHTPRSH